MLDGQGLHRATLAQYQIREIEAMELQHHRWDCGNSSPTGWSFTTIAANTRPSISPLQLRRTNRKPSPKLDQQSINKTHFLLATELRPLHRVWGCIFTLVNLQMITSIRPLINNLGDFLDTKEERLFLNNWFTLAVAREFSGEGAIRKFRGK